jgi:hypothetical protein
LGRIDDDRSRSVLTGTGERSDATPSEPGGDLGRHARSLQRGRGDEEYSRGTGTAHQARQLGLSDTWAVDDTLATRVEDAAGEGD